MLNKSGSVFIYAMMISFFAVIIGYIITIKIDTLIENFDIQNYDTKLHSNIREKSNFTFEYDTAMNTNGSGLTNTISCPDIVSMSGTLGGTSEIIATVPFFSDPVMVCSGSTSQGNLLLSYSSRGTIFENGTYLGSTIALDPVGGTGARTGTFSDEFGTFLSFTATGTLSGLDLDRNSDNFQASSSSTVLYPGNVGDDDDLARKTLYGYVPKDAGWYNVFLMNTPLRKYIGSNSLNTNPLNVIPGVTQTGYLRLEADNPYNIRVVEFDKAQFESTKEFRVFSSTIASASAGGIGWIMPDLSLSGTKSGAKVFDLKNKDYAVFLSFTGNTSSTGVTFLKYKLTMEDSAGLGVYIAPINDSENGIMKYLGTDIIIDSDGDYRYKQTEIIRENTLLIPVNNGCLFGAFFGSGCLFF